MNLISKVFMSQSNYKDLYQVETHARRYEISCEKLKDVDTSNLTKNLFR